MTTTADVGGVKSARRVLDVLELLSLERGGLTFPEIGSRLQLPKSSLHALLWTLAERRWITLDEATRRYRIGVRAWESGQAFLDGVTLASLADKHLRAARDELDETVQLAILDGIDNVYIAKVEANHPLRLVSNAGSRLPAYATGLGKVLLSSLSTEELHRRFHGVAMQRFTSATLCELPALEKRLDRIREVGYGTDDGEYTVGVSCVAAPVRDHTGAIAAAMSCSVPRARLDARETGIERIRDILIKHARALSSELGWRPAVSDGTPMVAR